MTTSHTPGRLKLFTTYAMPEIRTQDDVFVANTPPRTEANARRLVAAWNACDGLPTSDLANSALPEIMTNLMEAKVQRDELLEALKLAEAALSDIGDADREPGDDVAWCESRAAAAIPAARAAIAKAEGKMK